MDIKAILLDFDGTTLQNDQVFISYRNKIALSRAMEKGIQIIPSTGRVEDMFPPQIEADKRIRYWVTSNGARVVDRLTRNVLYQSTFTPQESAELCRIFEGQQIYSEIAAAGLIFMEKEVCANLDKLVVPPHHVWFIELGRQVEVDKPSSFLLSHGIGIEKVNIYGVPPEKQQPLINAFEATGFIDVYEGAGKDIQFFPKRLERPEAHDTLFKHLGIGYENIMAIGDSTLDAPGIEKAKLGVVVGNAPEWLKEKADYVTSPSHLDGVAEAIEKFLL